VSKKYDSFKTIRLTPKNHEKLQLIVAQLPISTSIVKLANKAIEEWPGFQWVRRAKR